jgi:hypothetical protein
MQLVMVVTPAGEAEAAIVQFERTTQGRWPAVDAITICESVLVKLESVQLRAVLAYLNQRFDPLTDI